MKLTARIVKATRNSTDSQHWLSSSGFRAVAEGTIKLAPCFSDDVLIQKYLGTWSSMLTKLNSDCPMFFDHVILEDDMNHLSLLFYETHDDWKLAMDSMSGTTEKDTFCAVRNQLAELWGVTITIHQPVEFELSHQSPITMQEVLDRLTDSTISDDL